MVVPKDLHGERYLPPMGKQAEGARAAAALNLQIGDQRASAGNPRRWPPSWKHLYRSISIG